MNEIYTVVAAEAASASLMNGATEVSECINGSHNMPIINGKVMAEMMARKKIEVGRLFGNGISTI